MYPNDSNESIRAIRDTINPEGLSMNCQRCAVAYEMRQRGFDVQASDGAGDALGMPSNILRAFVGADSKSFSSLDSDELTDSVLKQMQDWGDGARAIIATQCTTGGAMYGHAYNLSCSNGEVIVADSQVGICWSDKTSLKSGGRVNLGLEIANTAFLIRTDKAKPGIGVADYVKNREA